MSGTGELNDRPSCALPPSSEDIGQLASLFSVLANPTRLRLLLALHPDLRAGAPLRPTMPDIADQTVAPSDAELCVCDLAAITDASQSMTSHQLHLLRRAGLVTVRRIGKHGLYRLSHGPHAHLLLDALAYVATSRISETTL